MIRKIFNVIIVVLFLFWVYALASDYNKVKNGEKATFCYEQVLYDYTDGSVEECKGILYKAYYYNRDSINVAADFGPFWIKMKE